MEKIKNSRVKSFIMVSLVYLVATCGGIIIYDMLTFNTLINLLIADVFATLTVFLYSIVFGNTSVYDPYWSVAPIVIVCYEALSCGFNFVSALIFIAVILWGLRFTLNWAYTFKNLTHQDWRYTMLKEKTGVMYPLINLLGIHMFPTIVVYLCIIPTVYAFQNQLSFNIGSLIFFLVSIFAIILQGVSDFQMHKYRKNKNGNFIRTGLWRHSRHPNYLGEILMWWGVALTVVFAIPSMWYLVVGALVNTLMFIFVSIPMQDKRQSKKEGFDDYKKETRALFPVKKIR
ncbi:MAG: DUF1295 domain-containing protein [Clostridia bacterium]|nr:DUF1295 domain-containing protein [Clostridia bacterium]